MSDPVGCLILPPKTRATTFRWGKLDGALAAGGTATVSLWQGSDGSWGGWAQDSGQNWEEVYAPPMLTSDSIASGSWVLVAKVNGRKVVLEAWTKVTVMTNFQVDATNKKLQKKTQATSRRDIQIVRKRFAQLSRGGK